MPVFVVDNIGFEVMSCHVMLGLCALPRHAGQVRKWAVENFAQFPCHSSFPFFLFFVPAPHEFKVH